MKRFMNLITGYKLLISLVVFAVLLAFGCSKRLKPSEIKIGVVGPFTGEGATYGESMRRGFELAFQNKPGFKLIYEDSEGYQ